MKNEKLFDPAFYNGKRLRFYRNLRTKQFSVQSKQGGQWKLAGQCNDHLILVDAVFIVSEKSRQRVLKTRQKNVHAWIEGIAISEIDSELNEPAIGITYCPYRYNSFVERETEKPVFEAEYVFIQQNKVHAIIGQVGELTLFSDLT